MSSTATHNPSETVVALIMGGWNKEREVSLSSGQSILASLKRQNYQVHALDLKRDLREFLDFIDHVNPHIVFNGLHGLYVEDGRLQGLLDILNIPYTHSGHRSSALAMHKPTAKILFESAGIPCAKGAIFQWKDIQEKHPLPPPYVVKPIDEGSSVGVYIVHKGDTPLQGKVSWPFSTEVLVEEYIAGHELSCAVMGDKALGILELRPKEGFYDYRAKYTPNMTDHLIPPNIPEAIQQRIMSYALKAHQVLGCAGVSRSDFRYDPTENKLCILETNTQPGFTDLSIVPEIAAHVGISFDQLVQWLIEDGLCHGSRR